MTHYWATFLDLIAAPFRDAPGIWGIVPLYFALLVSEMTSSKANYRTAIQTGFSFLWAAAQWIYPFFYRGGPHGPHVRFDAMLPVNLLVTCLVLALGALALFCGLRRRFPPYSRFLGHIRFANYFMITLFPIQTHALDWTWDRFIAIVLFAVPVWLALHFGLMPLRRN